MTSNTIPRPISDVASDLGIRPEHLVLYGDEKAKIRLEARAASQRPPGKLVLVSAITPTSAGEGKTTTSIGLAQGLAKLGHRVCLALREPSLGPTFGMKGGATGGGKIDSGADGRDQLALHRRFSRDYVRQQSPGFDYRQSHLPPKSAQDRSETGGVATRHRFERSSVASPCNRSRRQAAGSSA